MKNNNRLNYKDSFIIIVIVIQLIIFILNFERNTFTAVFALAQMILLIIYLVFAVRQRASYESVVNIEREFFRLQINEIKQNALNTNYNLEDLHKRQMIVKVFENVFGKNDYFYHKKIKADDGSEISIDLLMISKGGIYLIDLFDGIMVLKGDYQNDKITVQYTKNHQIEIINPLSKHYPAYNYLVKALDIKDSSMIKTMIVLDDRALAMDMDTLNPNQIISKTSDFQTQLTELIEKNKVTLSDEQVEDYISKLEEKIAG